MKKILCSLALLLTALIAARAENIMALTSSNRLLVFDSATPQTATQAITVTGLQTDESLLAIDFRPFTGGLYALGSSSRIYVIDTATGVATVVPAGLSGNATTFTLEGSSFGFDFNPTVDRIRLTSDTGQNLRLNPGNGTLTATDGPLAYAAGDPNAGASPNIVGSAYTNSVPGAQATVLYNIDSDLDILVTQSPPNAGTLNTVGALGIDTSDAVGFDISPLTGVAYAYLTVATGSTGTDGAPLPGTGLYTINLATGAATFIGPVVLASLGTDEEIIGLAVPGMTRLLNISTRGRVGNDENVLIGGFVLRGVNNARFLLRAIGPSLSDVGAPLQDPVLTLFDRNRAVVATNDDWQTAANAGDVTATGIAPQAPSEAAILISLPPGDYTAHVTGKGGATGVALVEVYQLP